MRFVALAAALVWVGQSATAGAECDEVAAKQRADDLRRNLTNEAERMRSWKVTWTAVFTGGAIGQYAIANLFEGDDRRTFDVGAAKAALGAVTTPFLAPRFSVPDPVAGESTCDDVVRLEAALVIAGRKQAKGVAWFQHFPGAAVNLVGILYLGLAHDLWLESLLGAAFGTAVGELKLFTQPRRAIGWAQSGAVPSDSPWVSRLRITSTGRSIGLQFSF